MKTLCTLTPKGGKPHFPWRSLTKAWHTLLFTFLLVIAQQAAATIRYVKPGGTGPGTSWGNASGDVQAMINASSSGDQVWVAGGSFQRASGQYFSMKNGVMIYGGFAGTETALSQRNLTITANTTTLQGNNSSVFFNAGLSTASVLDGFTITGGSNASWGGGIFNYYASPTISNCLFTGNNANISGGGLYNFYASGIISNCVFTGNHSNGYGGGVENDQSSAVYTNCTFDNNTSTNGGGIFENSATTTFINCTVSGNWAQQGGGIYITKNNAASGKLVNCLITGNSGVVEGGGLVIDQTSEYMINCTIASNYAPALKGGSIFITASTTLTSTIRNSIAYGNSDGIDIDNSNNLTDIAYCLVQGLTGTANGNINGNTDPRFVNMMNYTSAGTAGDYRLQYCSPAINAGNNVIFNTGQSPDLSAITTDIAAATRIQGTAVDMGAYEFAGNPVTGANLLAVNDDVTTATISGTTTLTATASVCRLVATLLPTGTGTALSGTVNGEVWIESTQPANYVKRHYEITPATNAATATGRVTLYFTQADFDAFNAVNTLLLPTGPTDVAHLGNLMIEQHHGTSSDGSGRPATYNGTAVTIDPADADIVWNSTASRWEVTFDVSGFSGFFVKTQATILPLSTVVTPTITRTTNNDISIYPNPATNVINIRTGTTLLNTHAGLYDANGRLLQTILINTIPQAIHVQSLTNGLYILKFANGVTEKFIKK